MAALPSLPTFGAMIRAKSAKPDAADHAAAVDAKVDLARRLRDEDAARRLTSVAPPRSVA
jgi:hypothetical protein